MAITKVATIMIHNLKTISKFVDHLVVECYSDSGLTAKVGSKTSKTKWDGTYSQQVDAMSFTGLVFGSTYYFRAGVVCPISGVITWSSTYSVAAGTASVPTNTYTVNYVPTFAGIAYWVTAVSPPSDVNHYEAYWNASGTTPASTQVPNWRGTGTGNVFHFFVGHDVGNTVHAWVRAVTTSGKVQTWYALTSKTVRYVDPSAGDVLAKGSTPQAITDGFSYTSTTTNITWSWSALRIYRADGTITDPADSTESNSSLTNTTTYYFYPYYDEANSLVKFVTGSGHGTSDSAFLSAQRNHSVAQTQNLQGRLPLSTGPISAATTSSGSGGGSGGGGGSCVRSRMLVHERAKGIIPAREVQVDDWLETNEGDGWTRVVFASEQPQDLFIRSRVQGHSIEVTPTHPYRAMDENCNHIEHIAAGKLSCMHQLYTRDGADFIEANELVCDPDGKKMVIACEGIHTFLAGESEPFIEVHNVMMVC